MRTERTARRLVVYAGQPRSGADSHAVSQLLRAAARHRLDGASLFAGFLGFGSQHHMHEGGLLHGPDETPLTLTIVDEPYKITAFCPS